MDTRKYVVKFSLGDEVEVYALGAIDAMAIACAQKAKEGRWNYSGKVIDISNNFVYQFNLTEAIKPIED